MKHTIACAVTLAAAVLLLAGCNRKEAGEPTAAAAAASGLDKVVVVEKGPQGVGVLAAKKVPASGDTVVVEGKVKDFVEDMAVFTLVDHEIKSCADMHMKCPTPWDYCCIAKPTLLGAMATVKVVDAGGQAVRQSLQGLNSLDHLSTVTVTGKPVRDAQGNLVVEATRISVQK